MAADAHKQEAMAFSTWLVVKGRASLAFLAHRAEPSSDHWSLPASV